MRCPSLVQAWSVLYLIEAEPTGTPVDGQAGIGIFNQPFIKEHGVYADELHGFAAVGVCGQHPAQLWIL